MRKDLCVFAREAKEVCKTERGYPASLPRHSCYICFCPLTHQRVGSTGHRRIPDHDTLLHEGQLILTHMLVQRKHNDMAINVLFTHKTLKRQSD